MKRRAYALTGVLQRLTERRETEVSSKPTDSATGIVEVFERNEVVGWVEVPPHSEPVRIGVYINDFEACGAWAHPWRGRRSALQIRRFRFELCDLWEYAKKTDRVSVRADGVPMPIASKGMFYYPRRDGSESLESLRRLQSSGYVFGQTGRLQLSKMADQQWQNDVMSLYEDVSRVLCDGYGYRSFFCYGTLLGAIREAGFIGHDLDFDCAYISKYQDGRMAAQELQQVAFSLIDAGFQVSAKWSCLAVSRADSPNVKIDLFHLYFDMDNRIQFPFGVAGQSELERQDIDGFQELSFVGKIVDVPRNPERLVEHIYGPDWRTPNPGFNWDIDRTNRAPTGKFADSQRQEIYWANFYAHKNFTDGGSTFSRYVMSLDGIPSRVIDIGCGDGRDTFAFADSGMTATGLDRSHVGVRYAQSRANKVPGSKPVFHACDVEDTTALRALIDRVRSDKPESSILFYMRFFLHSIPQETQDALLSTLSAAAQEGDYLAAEFRTDRDADLRKVHNKHYRRYQSAEAFVKQLRNEYGFRVLIQQEGNGLSPYGNEDPQLCRVVARR